MSKKYDLGWGNPIAVAEALDRCYTPKLVCTKIMDLSYPPKDGLPSLVKWLKNFTGYKHIIITNGAMGAINIVLRALRASENRCICATNELAFPFYKNIIGKCNYFHNTNYNEANYRMKNIDALRLIDIPSNPFGKIEKVENPLNNVIWDSVYNSPIYVNSTTPEIIKRMVAHRVNIDSFSKRFGIPGLRLGWIGTNSTTDYDLFSTEGLYDTHGVSLSSQLMMMDILENINMSRFENIAKSKINYNREEFELLGNLFSGQEVPVNGMFYAINVDNKVCKLLDKAEVGYIILPNINDLKTIRFNLTQNNELTKKAIRAIIKADKI
jgi:aspartate/methionine/tyrosine aminotransferase